MIELLYSIDVMIFFFINHSLSNPLLDLIMPFLTDLNKNPLIVSMLGVWILYMLWKGGRTARVTIGLLVITVIFSDQLNSSLIKELFGRERPCRALEGVRLLIGCGGGHSFPSSHAVNNFAAAFLIGHFYRSSRWYWYAFAAIVALSRPYVGVHYPSDIVVGALLGIGIGFTITSIWEIVSKKLVKDVR